MPASIDEEKEKANKEADAKDTKDFRSGVLGALGKIGDVAVEGVKEVGKGAVNMATGGDINLDKQSSSNIQKAKTPPSVD